MLFAADGVNLLLTLEIQCTATCGTSNRIVAQFRSRPLTRPNWPGRRMLPGFGKDAAMRIAPVCEFICRSTNTTWPFVGIDFAIGERQREGNL